MMKSREIVSYLNELIPNPRCELNYKKDYELLLAVMLSAQTTDKRVNMVTDILFRKYPTLEDLANASLDDLIGIIRPIGTYHKKAKNIKNIANRLLIEQAGKVPNDREYLESLDGVGRKTSNVVLSNLFDEPYIAVDTHVSRVSKRLGIAKKDDDVLKVEKKLYRFFKEGDRSRLHHQLVLFGRYHCKAIHPACEHCQLQVYCKYKKNRTN